MKILIDFYLTNKLSGLCFFACMAQSAKRGFTLVELSITIVIIGLLIGGLLVGQSLIDSARVNRLISDLRQYEVATVQFQKKFKYYPGDSAFFTPPGLPNNVLNNGANGGANCAAAPNTTFRNREADQFWAHLSQAQMIKTNYPGYSPTSCSGTYSDEDYWTGKIAPYTKVDSHANELVVNGSYSSPKASITVYKTFSTSSLFFNIFLIPADELALENKLGGIQSVTSAWSYNKPLTGLAAVTSNSTTPCYDIDSNSVSCSSSVAAVADVGYFLSAP